MGKELKTPPLGRLITVSGYNMHIFTEGEGEKTLVFMSGHGTACPTLDFKPLWSLLTDKFKIAVVEKFGYGWSDITNLPRDLDTILENSRELLKKAGLLPPYILVPHSLSGLEAVYWAQKYPQEVDAIIGLDPSVPDMAEAMKVSFLVKFSLKLTSLLSGSGMSDATAKKILNEKFPSFRSDSLTDSDRAAYIEIFQNRTWTADMLQEINHNPEYVKRIRSLPLPSNVPIYYFSSNFEGMSNRSLKPSDFLQFQKEFLQSFKNAKHMILDCGHYIHSFEAKKIADEMKLFIDET